jgi:hypothetical protein
MPERPNLTQCGLPGIDRVPYGMHACHFYADRQQLIDALVPYFVAGLKANERCLWITAPPLPASEASSAIQAAWDRSHDAMENGALRILDYDQWYSSSARLKGLDVVRFWLEEEERALAEGYSGLRITGKVTFLKPGDWPAFMEYERAVSAGFSGRRIVALCSYLLPGCSAQQVSEVMHAHDCAFERPDESWQVAAAFD